MADDPKKRGKQDRNRVSQQDHEQAYQSRKRRNAGSEQRTSSRSGNNGRTGSESRDSGRRSSSRSSE